MAELPISKPIQTGAVVPAETRANAKPSTDGPAFRALLEELELRAKALRQDADRELAPEDIAPAVSRARDSLAGALSLGDQLLEAVRQRAMQDEPRAPRS
jgi:hypothetical protein